MRDIDRTHSQKSLPVRLLGRRRVAERQDWPAADQPDLWALTLVLPHGGHVDKGRGARGIEYKT